MVVMVVVARRWWRHEETAVAVAIAAAAIVVIMGRPTRRTLTVSSKSLSSVALYCEDTTEALSSPLLPFALASVSLPSSSPSTSSTTSQSPPLSGLLRRPACALFFSAFILLLPMAMAIALAFLLSGDKPLAELALLPSC